MRLTAINRQRASVDLVTSLGGRLPPFGDPSTLGGGVYTFRGMAHHMSMRREFYACFSDLSPGIASLEGCESLLTHPEGETTIMEKFLVPHLLTIQEAPEMQELQDAYWLPVLGNPLMD